MLPKPKILFLCSGNSCRSQMAEGWLRHLKGERYSAYSAGITCHGLNPRAVQVMLEVGVDICHQLSQCLNEIPIEPDVVITVCGHADENCPILPTETQKIHIGFDDPPEMARNARSDEEALQHYRRVRDEIRQMIENIEQHLK